MPENADGTELAIQPSWSWLGILLCWAACVSWQREKEVVNTYNSSPSEAGARGPGVQSCSQLLSELEVSLHWFLWNKKDETPLTIRKSKSLRKKLKIWSEQILYQRRHKDPMTKGSEKWQVKDWPCQEQARMHRWNTPQCWGRGNHNHVGKWVSNISKR